MTAATIVRDALESARLSVGEASRLTGVSPQTIRRLLDDSVLPQIATVRKLADALEIDFDALWAAAQAEDSARERRGATA